MNDIQNFLILLMISRDVLDYHWYINNKDIQNKTGAHNEIIIKLPGSKRPKN